MIDGMVGTGGRVRANLIGSASSGRLHLRIEKAACGLVRTSEAVGWRGAFMTHGWIEGGAAYDGQWSWLRVIAAVPSSPRQRSAVRVQAPLVPSRGVVEEGGAYLCLNIDPRIVETYTQRTYSQEAIHDVSRGLRDDALVAHLLQALDADVAAGSPSGPALGEAVIAAILHRLQGGQASGEPGLTLPHALAPAPSGRALSARDRRMVEEYIAARLAAPIHLDEVAKLLGLGVRQLGRVFPSAFGASPHQYILGQRLEHAIGLLRTTRLSLDEVAEKSGFADQSHMTTTLRRRSGLTPLQIRHASK